MGLRKYLYFALSNVLIIASTVGHKKTMEGYDGQLICLLVFHRAVWGIFIGIDLQ